MNLSKKNFQIWATFFYVGYAPVAGSLASGVGLALAYMLSSFTLLHLFAIIIVSYIGFKVSAPMEEYTQAQDPSCIVIDEVAGVLVAFFLIPWSWPVAVIGFFLFRAFDMFKLYPVNLFEKDHKPSSIMLDDLIAGLYTNLTLQVAIRLAGVV